MSCGQGAKKTSDLSFGKVLTTVHLISCTSSKVFSVAGIEQSSVWLSETSRLSGQASNIRKQNNRPSKATAIEIIKK